MPIYDYVCGSCGHRFEVFRGINEAGPHQCPECGGPVARAFMPPTIHFKGSGWAKTGPPGNERARAPGRHRGLRVGPAGILSGQRVREASRIAGNERRRRRDVLGWRRDAGEANPTRRGSMRPR